MHPALHSWRDELPGHAVRLMAYVGGLVLLSIVAAEFYQSTPVKTAIAPVDRSDWIEIDKPFPAFTLSIPEAAGQPERYAIRRHAAGDGRKDILGLGDPDGLTPYFEVAIYRAGSEIARFAPPIEAIVSDAAALGPVNIKPATEPLATKFGPLAMARFETSQGAKRFCLGFVRSYDDPMLQISGRFCQGDSFVQDSTLSCALDRLTLLYAGSEPKIGALFAHAELNRSYCGQRDPLMTPTPKYRALWKALEMGPPPVHRTDR
ncbi:hypothetical protein [Undibacter mobilis]|uniref:Uncharacterized protein n=1 Tax=Undibacter mobilis TaxID=2292256 RepID=A0A371B9D9_9BRAD|nr:hypothetical protein [Undibacter mobilis]RDV04198.1 hypothetical protein DXH78_06135 [Undibacter mobilis]